MSHLLGLPVVEPAAPPLLAVRSLRVVRGGRPILDRISAEITRGQITAVIGLNGSGKSTFLRTLLGEFPHTGAIEFRCGHDHSKPRPEHVGYVPQRLQFDPRTPLTVKDLLGLALLKRPLFLGVPKRVLDRVVPLLDRVGVGGLLNVPVEGLSGGQLQRILLALALEPKPELLLLDEPASGVDFKDQKRFYELIGELNRETGVTVVLVSHDIPSVNLLASHVICLVNGLIACQGPPLTVLTPEAIAGTFGHQMAATLLQRND
ncbi:MAG TPA: metal ABC transporter ATP-binding protein [Fimbriiglobus sp.]|jgi:zinc transport system ATP-binding protein